MQDEVASLKGDVSSLKEADVEIMEQVRALTPRLASAHASARNRTHNLSDRAPPLQFTEKIHEVMMKLKSQVSDATVTSKKDLEDAMRLMVKTS